MPMYIHRVINALRAFIYRDLFANCYPLFSIVKFNLYLFLCLLALTSCGPSQTELKTLEALRTEQVQVESLKRELESIRSTLALKEEKLKSAEAQLQTLQSALQSLEDTRKKEKEAVAPFRQLAEKMLLEASRLQELTRQGVSSQVFSEQLASASGAYNLMMLSWPQQIGIESQRQMNRAFEGWDLANKLWSTKNSDQDTPTEPDINRFDDIVSYIGDSATIKTYHDGYIVVKYRGKKYLPFDENIAALLGLASAAFEEGKVSLVKSLAK